MNDLTAVRSLTTLPVVTLGGDVVAQVKDTVFDASAERIGGFTLTGPALLSGPVPQDLPWPPVHCLGPHAVMVRGPEALFDLPLPVARRDALRGRLLGARGVTETGEAVGVVPDVLVGGGTGGRGGVAAPGRWSCGRPGTDGGEGPDSRPGDGRVGRPGTAVRRPRDPPLATDGPRRPAHRTGSGGADRFLPHGVTACPGPVPPAGRRGRTSRRAAGAGPA